MLHIRNAEIKKIDLNNYTMFKKIKFLLISMVQYIMVLLCNILVQLNVSLRKINLLIYHCFAE